MGEKRVFSSEEVALWAVKNQLKGELLPIEGDIIEAIANNIDFSKSCNFQVIRTRKEAEKLLCLEHQQLEHPEHGSTGVEDHGEIIYGGAHVEFGRHYLYNNFSNGKWGEPTEYCIKPKFDPDQPFVGYVESHSWGNQTRDGEPLADTTLSTIVIYQPIKPICCITAKASLPTGAQLDELIAKLKIDVERLQSHDATQHAQKITELEGIIAALDKSKNEHAQATKAIEDTLIALIKWQTGD